MEDTVNVQHLHEELLQSAQSLPPNSLIILKNFNEDNPNTPLKVDTFTFNNIDKYVKIIQEFSWECFLEEVICQAELRAMQDTESTKEDNSSTDLPIDKPHNGGMDKVNYSTLPPHGPYTENHVPML